MIGDSIVADKFEVEINDEGDSNIFGCDEGEYSPEIYPHYPFVTCLMIGCKTSANGRQPIIISADGR